MYRELLTPYLKEYTYAVLQEPCSEETIRETEKAVGLPFPEELKTLLRETNGDRWLLLSADEIAENARLNRKCSNTCFSLPPMAAATITGIFLPTMVRLRTAFICGGMRISGIKRLRKALPS